MKKIITSLIAAAVIFVGGGYFWQINSNESPSKPLTSDESSMKPFDLIDNLGFSLSIPTRFNATEPESVFGFNCETEDNDPDAGIILRRLTDSAEMETKLGFAVVNIKKCLKMPIRFPERNLITDESYASLLARVDTDPFFTIVNGIPVKVSSETAGPILSAFIYNPDHVYQQAHISWADPAIMSLSWVDHDSDELWADVINADASKLPPEAVKSIKEFYSILETVEFATTQ